MHGIEQSINLLCFNQNEKKTKNKLRNQTIQHQNNRKRERNQTNKKLPERLTSFLLLMEMPSSGITHTKCKP